RPRPLDPLVRCASHPGRAARPRPHRAGTGRAGRGPGRRARAGSGPARGGARGARRPARGRPARPRPGPHRAAVRHAARPAARAVPRGARPRPHRRRGGRRATAPPAPRAAGPARGRHRARRALGRVPGPARHGRGAARPLRLPHDHRGGLMDLTRPQPSRTPSSSAANPPGAPGQGGRAEHGTPSTAYASRELPIGWKKSPCIDLGPHETRPLADIEGPGVIQHLWMTTLPRHWRRIVLTMQWDEEEHPAVHVPLGDFFCQGWETYAPVTSVPITVAPAGGLNSYFEMPFTSRARISVTNLGPETIEGVFFQITWAQKQVAEDALRFRAQWRRSDPLEYAEPHVILDGVEGAGHLVGTYLAWETHHPGWWGEGEVKFYLDDDEDFPTICGTG